MEQNDCGRCRGSLSDLVGLELARAQAREPHLLVCAGCRAELRQYRELAGHLDAALPDDAGEDLTELVLARVSREPDPAWLNGKPGKAKLTTAEPEGPLFWGWWRILVPAFGLALVLMLIGRPGSRLPSQGVQVAESVSLPTERPVAVLALTGTAEVLRNEQWEPVSHVGGFQARSTVRTAGASSLMLGLADGSRVTLHADTTALVADRAVDLTSGRARFEITRDPGRTFRVRVPDGEIRVLGTVFEVSVSSVGVTRVALFSGSIEIESHGQVERIAPGQVVTLTAGRLHVDGAPTVSETPSATPEPSTAATPPWDLPHTEARPASGPPPIGVDGR